MPTAANTPPAETVLPSPGIAWAPLALVFLVALLVRDRLPPWAFMWGLAMAIYAALKWASWWRSSARAQAPPWRSAGYLLAWPGMDAESFLDAHRRVPAPALREWIWACSKTISGALLLWMVARRVPVSQPLLRAWIGLIGMVLLAHFGTFHMVALIWQACGVAAEPIMAAPILSTSLSEFWGKRWNLGFRQLAQELIFRPLHRTLGAGAAGFLVFVASGLIHDFVISLPARGGYGLPTLYFLLQGAGVTVERSRFGKRLGLRHGMRGWCFMAVFLTVPIFWLFHPWFVLRVILPFLRAIHAL